MSAVPRVAAALGGLLLAAQAGAASPYGDVPRWDIKAFCESHAKPGVTVGACMDYQAAFYRYAESAWSMTNISQADKVLCVQRVEANGPLDDALYISLVSCLHSHESVQ